MELINFHISKSPASERDEKTLGYFCCVTGPISCSVRLAKTGFVEGETVMANVGINNQSNRVMEESTCRLLQKITYSSGNKKKVRLRDSPVSLWVCSRNLSQTILPPKFSMTGQRGDHRHNQAAQGAGRERGVLDGRDDHSLWDHSLRAARLQHYRRRVRDRR